MQTITRLLAGKGRFIADETLPDMVHMGVLRSPAAHGRITGLNTAAALALPGVLRVLTASDVAETGPLDCRETVQGLDGPMVEPYRGLLADGKVVHVGQPVAVVLAENEAIAQDALEVIDLEIDALPAVTDPETAHQFPPIWQDAPENRSFRWETGNIAETAELIAGAAHVVDLIVRHPRIAINPVETRGCLAVPDGNRLTLITPSQGVKSLQAALADCLGLDPASLRILTYDVGGSFAVKIWPYAEQALALFAAQLLGRPVRWLGSRSDAFTADAAGRGRVDRARLALDADGRFLAFQIDALADMGAFLNRAAPSIVSANSVRPYAQLYHIPGQHYRVSAIFTNTVPTDAYRGAGKPETTATLERLIEVAAGRIGTDPFELRRLNLIRPEQIPYITPMGETMDAGNFPALADRIHAQADWAGFPCRKAASAAKGLLRGGAVSFHLHASGGSTVERSEVRALPNGTVLVRTSAQDSGQSHFDSLALVAAKVLDLRPERIRVEQGDSDQLEIGGGTGGSNLLPVAGQTVRRTALAMLDQARAQAGEMLEAAEADLDYGDGIFRIIGTDRSVTLAEVAEAMGEENDPGCMARLDFDGIHTTWPNGAFACEVEVDPDTGGIRVDRFTGITDAGEIINEPAALGQVHGGIGQGLGEALTEGMTFDEDGQPLTGSFMDYGMPRADDLPMLDHDWVYTPSPNSVINAKGIGELSSIGAPGVFLNAVMDALRPHGIEHLDMPLTPSKVWQALRK
ncbi:MAG: xanthine dehydrogenase family protein molybdopterin-binding subunit [Pseudomonadota bacterium]